MAFRFFGDFDHSRTVDMVDFFAFRTVALWLR